MIKQRELESELRRYHLQRNKNVWIFHILLALSSTYIQREKLMTQPYCWVALTVIIIGLSIRSYVFNFHAADWLQEKKWAKVCNYLSLFILTSGWMIHYISIYLAYGPKDPHSSYALIFISGLITGATVTLLAHRVSFVLYTSVMCFVPILIFIFDPLCEKSIIFPISVFYIFNMYTFRIGHFQLKRSIENEIRTRKDKEQLTRIIDSVPGFVGVVNSLGEVTLANQATRSIYPDIIGKKIGNIDGSSNWENEVQGIINSSRQSAVTEQYTNISGKDIWALLNIQKTDDGGAVVVSIIITELVEARKLLREQEGKAQYAAKLASLGEMAAGIAHEINNPLTIIQGSASLVEKLLTREPLDKEKLTELTSKLIRTSDRISKTIKSLKSLSRSGENDPFEKLSLSDVVAQCLEVANSRLEKAEIQVRNQIQNTDVSFQGREVQISQVIMNLISNAIDAVKNSNEKWIDLSYREKDEILEVLIKDSGPGIPLEIRNKIMEPFFTTKEVNQGTGLGLSISKSILISHGGELILAEEKPTTFILRLPKRR